MTPSGNNHEYVSLTEIADRTGMDRSGARKYILSLGYKPTRKRTPNSRGQTCLAFTAEQAADIIRRRTSDYYVPLPEQEAESGYYYVIRLVPEFDLRRVKLGFAASVPTRLAQHRTAAPTCKVVKTWPCKRAWEVTITDALVGTCAEHLCNEVYEADVDGLVQRADAIFSLLPSPSRKVPPSTYQAKD